MSEFVVEFTNGGPDMHHAELWLILAQGVKLTEINRTTNACSIGSNPLSEISDASGAMGRAEFLMAMNQV